MRFQPIIDFIERNQGFILTAHETPDADALGSEIAMSGILKYLGKDVVILNADPAPSMFEFMDPDGTIHVLDDPAEIPADVEKRSLLILDVNDVKNIGNVSVEILPRVREYFIIDHHERENSMTTSNLIEEDASSTCELLFGLAERLEVPLDFVTAQALYAGIVYDTGSFVYPKTTARTFTAAHKLVSAGVVPNDVYANMYENNSISFLLLQSKVLASLELHYDRHVAVQYMLRNTLEDAGAQYEEGQSLINIPLKSRDVRVSVFFKENEEGMLRCSLRSKGNIDVAKIAQQHGGGGHKTAAGFKCSGSLDANRDSVLAELKEYFA